MSLDGQERTENVSVNDLLLGEELPKLELAVETESEEAAAETETTTEESSISEEAVLKFLQEKGKSVNSIDDILKENDPFEGLPENEVEFLKYQKATNGTREDFEFYKQDWDKADPVELFRLKIKKESGLDLTKDEVIDYVDDVLDVDISDLEEMSVSDKVKINKELNAIKGILKEEQKNVSLSLGSSSGDSNDVVTLDNGIQMTKSEYDAQLKRHNDFVSKNKEIVNSVTDFSFEIKVKEKDGRESLKNYAYDVESQDRQRMLSIGNDVSKYIQDTYSTKDGFKQKEFNEDLLWLDRGSRNKMISSLLHQARAEAIEEVMKVQGNVNLTPKPYQSKPQKEGVKRLSPKDLIDL